jgi:transposase InsO family protein
LTPVNGQRLNIVSFTLRRDVTDTLEQALQASGCDQVAVQHKPRLLSDNGASYVSGELADWLNTEGMDHVRGAPYHPQTQGKIASRRCLQRLPASGDDGARL